MPPLDEPYDQRTSIGARERAAVKKAAEREAAFRESPEGHAAEDVQRRLDKLEAAFPDNKIKGAEGEFDVDGQGIARARPAKHRRTLGILLLANGAYYSEDFLVK